MIAPVRAAVEEYLRLCPYRLAGDGPLFVGARGGPLSPRVIQFAVAAMRGALGLPETANAARAAPLLRHPISSPARRVAAIQELLGHASLATTQVYTKVDSARCSTPSTPRIRERSGPDRCMESGRND